MAYHSYGGTIGVDWAGGSSYVLLAQVVSFTPPEVSITKAPGWHLTSANAFKSKIPGMVDADDASITLRFTGNEWDNFMDHLRDLGSWQITSAEGTVITFTGFLATVGGPDHQDDDTIMQTAAVCCNSIPAMTTEGSGGA